MPLKINIQCLKAGPTEYRGQLSIAELDMNTQDDLIQATSPMKYRLCAEFSEAGILLSGALEQIFRCECARCLKPFEKTVLLAPWRRAVPLAGEGAAAINNDCADLTPALREDMFLALPQHPLCAKDCRGIDGVADKAPDFPEKQPKAEAQSSAWAVLDQLNLD